MTQTLETEPVVEAEAEAAPSYGRCVYLGHDVTHTDARKRTLALEKAGATLKSFMFRRSKSNADYKAEWDNVELGVTEDRNYLKRIPALLKGLGVLLKHKQDLKDAKFIMARNFDMMFLAVMAKMLSGSKAKLVYDVPDVQEFFFGAGLKGKLFRAVERFMLARTALLCVTSPGYLRGYFEPVQGYEGKSFVWENKVLAEQLGEAPAEDDLNAMRAPPEPWVLCWHGTLRCPRSMKILSEAARRLGPKIQLIMRGKPTDHPELFFESFDGLANARFGGEYKLPGDLLEIYGPAHFVWCVDYFDPDGNSPLLLPNRVYQGGYMGVVPIGAQGQETGDYIARNNLGPQLELPLVESLVDFFEKLSWEDYLAMRDRVFANRQALFIETASDIRKLLAAIDAA